MLSSLHLPPLRPPPVNALLSRRTLTLSGGALLPFLAAPPIPALTADDVTQKAFLDISIDGEPAGRIVVGLYGAAAPAGAARFASLVSGEAGSSYRRKPFTKILPGYILHGGVVKPFPLEELTEEWESQRAAAAAPPPPGAVGIVVRDPEMAEGKKKIVARGGKLEVVEEGEVGPNGTEFVIVVGEEREREVGERAVVVGRVVEGMEVVERMAALDTVKENSSSPYFRVAKLIGDKRAVVAARGFNRLYSKVIVANCGLIN